MQVSLLGSQNNVHSSIEQGETSLILLCQDVPLQFVSIFARSIIFCAI